MQTADLLQLALRACHDHTAQPVLGDAVLESGWADARVTWLTTASGYSRKWLRSDERPDCYVITRTIKRATNISRKRAAKASRRWCRAVAAVLLFGGWSNERWPIERLHEPGFSGLDAWLPSAFDALGLSEMSHPGSWLGVNRTPAARFGMASRLLDAGLISQAQMLDQLQIPDLQAFEDAVIEDAAAQIRESDPQAASSGGSSEPGSR
jgi:hypothetical protein